MSTRKNVSMSEFLPVKEQAAKIDRIVSGDGANKGLCEQTRNNMERHLLLRADHDEFVKETAPILADYKETKTMIKGGIKLIIAFGAIVTIVNGMIALNNSKQYSDGIKAVQMLVIELKEAKNGDSKNK